MRLPPPVLALSIVALVGCAATAPGEDSAADLLTRAAAIHARALVLDTHVDISGESYATAELDPGIEQQNLRCDLVKMKRGGVDAVFLAVFVGQRGGLDAEGYAAAYGKALGLFSAIHRLPRMHPDRCAFAASPRAAEEVVRGGRHAILIGMENGYPIGEDLARLAEFHALGARYITLAHTDHNQICDSSGPAQPRHGGLSAFGEKVVAEMNRLGIMVDVSHISEASFRDVLRLTKAPVIASHSGCSAVNIHDRNLTDAQLAAVAKNGGTVQIVGLGSYLKTETEEHRAAVEALRIELPLPSRREMRAMSPEEREALQPRRDEFARRLVELEKTTPGPSVRDLVDHIEHAVRVAGVDHVGIGTDFDGGGGIAGFENHAESLNVTVELLRRGFSEEAIHKIWGGNLLRVWAEVERVAEDLARGAHGSIRGS